SASPIVRRERTEPTPVQLRLFEEDSTSWPVHCSLRDKTGRILSQRHSSQNCLCCNQQRVPKIAIGWRIGQIELRQVVYSHARHNCCRRNVDSLGSVSVARYLTSNQLPAFSVRDQLDPDLPCRRIICRAIQCFDTGRNSGNAFPGGIF